MKDEQLLQLPVCRALSALRAMEDSCTPKDSARQSGQESHRTPKGLEVFLVSVGHMWPPR